MPDPYLITYDGYGHQTGHRDTTSAVRFEVQRGGSFFYFACAMSRQALVGFREFSGDQLEELLASAGLDELERRLQSGVLPPEEGDYVEVLFTSDQYEHLKAIAEREKRCVWQERRARGWICRATESGGDERTTARLCAGCAIPDERVICDQLVHPEVKALTPHEALRRVPIRAMCNIGNDAGDGGRCRPGGLGCWQRHLDAGPTLPDPPADVARLAADEIDYLELVYRDRYGSKVWTIPQARSISELFGDCDSAEDFARRLAALADLLGKLDPYGELSEEEQKADGGGRVGPLVALRRVMERDHPEAVGAVETLRRIPDARNQFPMHTRSEKLLAAFRDLGVDFPASDWHLAWLQVLTAFWSSLRAIRSAIQTGPAESGEQEESAADDNQQA
jgi:hypothetical protein